MDWILKLVNVTLPVATIFCVAWLVIEGHNYEAVGLFLGGLIFTLIIKLIDHDLYMAKRHHYG